MVKQSSHLPRLNHEEIESKIRPIMCKEVESVIKKQQQQQQKPPSNNNNKEDRVPDSFLGKFKW